MVTQRKIIGVLGLAASAGVLYAAIGSTAPAAADTETCVGRTEFDNTERWSTPVQIANRYDVFGYFLDDTADSFRRGYRSCWAPGERRVVVVYSYDTGTSVDWYVRDV